MDSFEVKVPTTRTLVVEIQPDNDAQDPRTNDNLGKMICLHGRYRLGDYEHGMDLEEAKALEARVEKEGGVVLPLYLYDHSGITMRTKPFSCPWDSGKVGFIYATAEMIRANFRVKRVQKCHLDRARLILQEEVNTYDQYLTGDVYGFIVKDEEGETLDSCWGFFGREAAEEAGREAAANQGEKNAA